MNIKQLNKWDTIIKQILMSCYFQKGLYFAEISKIQVVKPIGNLFVHAVQWM